MFLFILSVFLLCLFALDRYLLSYWSRKSFPQLHPKFFIGDIGEQVWKKTPLSELFDKNYREFKNLKVLGLYFSYRPVLLVFDPDLVKKILIKDFGSFCDRSTYSNKKVNPLSGHLFNIREEKWRKVRSHLTTAFTPMQLKQMFPIVENCAENLKTFISHKVEAGCNVIEIRELFSRYMNTVLSSAVFGLENDCINERDNMFYRMNLQIFKPSRMAALRTFLHFLAPQLISKLGVKMVDQEVEDYLFSIINQSIELRKSKEFQRNDVMQVFIDLMNLDDKSIEFGLNDLAANVFLFFIAGNESSSTVLSACLYELVLRPDLMTKVQAEIDEMYEKETKITYESLKSLKLVDTCIAEAARKFPGAKMLTRECTEDYKISGTDLVISKGTQVYIPIINMHFDKEIFENPNDFNPERFTDSSTGSAKTAGTAYLPFGEGPRNCLGETLARVVIKYGLVTVLSDYDVDISNQNEAKSALKHDMQDFAMVLENKLHFRMSPRVKNQ